MKRIQLTLICFLMLSGCAEAQNPNPEDIKGNDVSFQEHPFFYFDNPSHFTAHITLVDIDDDGDLDALAANGRHWAQQDFAFINAGQGRMLEAVRVGPRMTASYILLPGDYDDDGDIDVIVVRDLLAAQIYTNDGNGNFNFSNTLEGSAGHARSAITLDINNDNHSDVVIATRRGHDIVFFGQGDAQFGPPVILPDSGKGSTSVDAGDLDRDGDLDLVFARRNGEASVIMINESDGNFTVKPLKDSQGDHRKTIVEDFDGDGLPDIFLLSTDGDHKLFQSVKGLASPDIIRSESNGPQSIAAGDLDQDGDIDLVIGDEGPNGLLFNNGGGSFEFSPMESENTDTYGVALGDMNGDGKIDIVFANSGGANIVIRSR